MIYFVSTGPDSDIKIGFSEVMTRRCVHLRWQVGKIICVMGVMDGGLEEESRLHQRFHAYRRHMDTRAVDPEWFERSPDLLAFIEAHARLWDGSDEREPMEDATPIREPIRQMQNEPIAIGTTFGRWTTTGGPLSIKRAGRSRSIVYPCRCDCGTERNVRADCLIREESLSCGCLHREIVGRREYTHGESRSRLYKLRINIIGRCYNPNCGESYDNYGGRGIVMCDEWRESYEAFRDWAMKNGYADNLEIDRIDVNGPYAPDNCRWVTRNENKDNRRNTIWIEAFGERKSLESWARDIRCAVPKGTLLGRITQYGWEAERAIVEPPRLPFGKRATKEERDDIRCRRACGESVKSIADSYGEDAQIIYRILRLSVTPQ